MGANDVDLEGLSIGDLRELKKRIDSRIDDIKHQNEVELLEMMEIEAAKRGVSLADIVRIKPKVKLGRAQDRRQDVKAKYRDANGNTWSGRGNAPLWVLEYLGVEERDKDDPEQTKKLAELLINDD
ncbi:MAG TPA: H-NS histone family protein [Roseovarius sp.]|nr:H-NS histone family protein [Roseovarius sp.]